MKEHLLSLLRRSSSDLETFRRASDQLAYLLASDTIKRLWHTSISIKTPVGVATGKELRSEIMFVPILRAGLSILPSFLQLLPDALVGIIGIERDEETAMPHTYYKKFPDRLPEKAVIIDPMLATGGTALATVNLLQSLKYDLSDIFFSGIVASEAGLQALCEVLPADNITLVVVDPELNAKKYIVPGLGDYGDRYYGT